jgi:hypothetical protein
MSILLWGIGGIFTLLGLIVYFGIKHQDKAITSWSEIPANEIASKIRSRRSNICCCVVGYWHNEDTTTLRLTLKNDNDVVFGEGFKRIKDGAVCSEITIDGVQYRRKSVPSWYERRILRAVESEQIVVEGIVPFFSAKRFQFNQSDIVPEAFEVTIPQMIRPSLSPPVVPVFIGPEKIGEVRRIDHGTMSPKVLCANDSRITPAIAAILLAFG